jgi:hypothetical protein
VLEIRVNMNSSVEDVLAFKTCCNLKLSDQNLEILVENKGSSPVVVPSYFDLEGDEDPLRVRTLIPSGDQTVPPGETIAFYCQMDEALWQKSKRLVMFDKEGNRYPVEIPQNDPNT